MDEYNKQIVGYLLMALAGGLTGLAIYYVGKLTLDPALISLLVFMIGSLEAAAYKWIKYNFALPDEEESPDEKEMELTSTVPSEPMLMPESGVE